MCWLIPERRQKNLGNHECYQTNLTSSKSSFISYMRKAERCVSKLENKNWLEIVCNITVWRYWLSSTYASYWLLQCDPLCCVLSFVTRALITLPWCSPPPLPSYFFFSLMDCLYISITFIKSIHLLLMTVMQSCDSLHIMNTWPHIVD